MSPKSSNNVHLKLLIDKKNRKVLFAEAGKDFVDFLLTLLSLPVSTVIRLLSKNGMVGSLGKLYNSVENLSDTYMQPNVSKDTLLKPKTPIGGGAACSALLALPSSSTSPTVEKFYVCGSKYCSLRHVSNNPNVVCPVCNYRISQEAPYVASPTEVAAAQTARSSDERAGYVKGVVSYMIMDDLEVMPMSTISGIAMLNKFNVSEVKSLEEKTVSLGMTEGLKLLEASLQSSTVLTDVFMQKKASRKR